MICSRCGQTNPQGSRFCNECGQALAGGAASSVALSGERKQVTVLFLDVKDSMSLEASVDAEVWRGAMQRLFELFCEVVERYGGTVDKFTGDGAMALFGAPIAYEDHAARACYAALDLRDALAAHGDELGEKHGLDFAARMGLNSGEAVAGGIGGDRTLTYTAIGTTVGLASRMESLAEPERPYLTRNTAALVDGYFELEDVGHLDVKGLPEPVHAFALVGRGRARTRLEAAGPAMSAFVGRESELAALEAALSRAQESGQVVGVVAEAGLGKSRLCHEFAERCRARGIQVTVGRGVAYGEQVPLLPVIEMLRSYFDIAEQDDDATARGKIEERLLSLDAAFADALPVMCEFLGVTDPAAAAPNVAPEAKERTLFSALAQLVRTRSEREASVMIVEDLQWLDPGSDAFLANLVESLPGGHVLLVVNFRPEYHADWMQRGFYQQLPLAAIRGEAIGGLVRDLIGDDPSLDGVIELVAARSTGNPFFIEEIVQRLVETGVLSGERGGYRLARSIEEIEIPASVQALLAARIDRLPERARSVLQAAAVLQPEVAEPVLQRVTGLDSAELAPVLEELVNAEMLHESALYPELRYAFRHPLTQEVAYRSQLSERRRATHAAAAQAIEAVYADRLDELAAVVAVHWEEAGENVTAAQWAARAATWAGAQHPADALRSWRRVRELTRDSEDPTAANLALTACMWILQFGWRLAIGDEEIDAMRTDGLRLAGAAGNTWAAAAVHGAYSNACGMFGHVRRAVEEARIAQRLADEAGDMELRNAVAVSYWDGLCGRYDEALSEIDRGMRDAGGDIAFGRRIIGFSIPIWLTTWRAYLLCLLGRLDEALELNAEGERLAREHDELELLGLNLCQYGTLAIYLGEGDPFRDRVYEALELAERAGSPFGIVTIEGGVAAMHVAEEEWNAALEHATRMRDVMEATRTAMQYRAAAHYHIARSLSGLGRTDEAAEAAAELLRAATAQGLKPIETSGHLELGRALCTTRPDEAEKELQIALEMAPRYQPALIPFAHEALAELAEQRSDLVAHQVHLDEAIRLFEAYGGRGHLRRLRERVRARS